VNIDGVDNIVDNGSTNTPAIYGWIGGLNHNTITARMYGDLLIGKVTDPIVNPSSNLSIRCGVDSGKANYFDYHNSSGVVSGLAPNITTTPKFLSMTGDGVNGATPSWQALSVIVSSTNISSVINVNSLTNIYISTINITQVGGKNLEITGIINETVQPDAGLTVSLYDGATKLQEWYVYYGSYGYYGNIPIRYSSNSSAAGAKVYTIRVKSSSTTTTQTINSYDWRVKEE
jgi:hypothetical protein